MFLRWSYKKIVKNDKKKTLGFRKKNIEILSSLKNRFAYFLERHLKTC